ncbi:MAG: hypothetical protein ACR2LX_10905 [Jatrophihabitans sp.]
MSGASGANSRHGELGGPDGVRARDTGGANKRRPSRQARYGATTPMRASAPRIPFALLVTGLIVGGMALLLVLNTASAANELRRHGLADRDSVIAAQLQDLRQGVAASAAPGNLAAQAAALGMVPGGDPAFLVIGAGGVVKVMGKPGPATEQPIPLPASTKVPAKKTATPKPSKSPPAKSGTKLGHPPASRTSAGPTSANRSPSTPKTSPVPPRPTPTPTVTLPGGTR